MDKIQFDFRDFSRIKIDCAHSVTITRADTYSIAVEAENTSNLKVEKIGNTLHVGLKRTGWLDFFNFNSRPHAVITMPELDEISLSGASHGKIQGFKSDRDLVIRVNGASHLEVYDMTTHRLHIDVSGASNLTGDIAITEDTDIRVFGASRVELTGNANHTRLDLSGASQAKLSNLSLSDTTVKISGASSAQIKVNGKLDLDVSGASRLIYDGNISLGDVRVTGASSLTHR
jgi:hypothetical protein